MKRDIKTKENPPEWVRKGLSKMEHDFNSFLQMTREMNGLVSVDTETIKYKKIPKGKK